MSRYEETDIHLEVCRFIRLRYKDVIFHSDGSGLPLSRYQAKSYAGMKSGRGISDLHIDEPRNGYHGLKIEIKKTTPFKKNGDLKAGDHLREQNEILERYNAKGYKAVFGTGVGECIKIIDEYMS